jgi:hypothetical protein
MNQEAQVHLHVIHSALPERADLERADLRRPALGKLFRL